MASPATSPRGGGNRRDRDKRGLPGLNDIIINVPLPTATTAASTATAVMPASTTGTAAAAAAAPAAASPAANNTNAMIAAMAAASAAQQAAARAHQPTPVAAAATPASNGASAPAAEVKQPAGGAAIEMTPLAAAAAAAGIGAPTVATVPIEEPSVPAVPLPAIESHNLAVAAQHIVDATQARKIGYATDRESLARYQIYHSRVWTFLFNLSVLIHLGMVLFEPPSSLTNNEVFCSGDGTVEDSGGSGGGSGGEEESGGAVVVANITKAALDCTPAYPNAPIVCVVFEFLCLLVYTIDFMLGVRCFTWFWLINRWTCTRLVVCVFIFIDTLVYVGTGFSYVHISRAVRPLIILTHNARLRKLTKGVLFALRGMWPVVLALTFHIIFCSVIGYILFGNVTDNNGGFWFGSIGAGMYNLLLVITTFNQMLPMMLPFWLASRWAVVFFLLFFIIGALFMYRTVFAYAFKSYKAYLAKDTASRLTKRQAALRVAFDKCTHDGKSLTRASWIKVCAIVRPDLDEVIVGLVFDTVRQQGLVAHKSLPVVKDAAGANAPAPILQSGVVGYNEFLHLFGLLTVKHDVKTLGFWDHPFIMPSRLALKSIITHSTPLPFKLFGDDIDLVWYQVAIAVLTILSAVQLCIVAPFDQANNSGWRGFGVFLLLMFAIQIVIELWVYGFMGYWNSSGFRRLDLMAVAGGIILYFATEVGSAGGIDTSDSSTGANANTSSLSSASVANFALAIRLLQITKILFAFQSVEETLLSVKRSVALMSSALLVFASLIYFFAIMGMALYADDLRPDNTSLIKSKSWLSVGASANFYDFQNSVFSVFSLSLWAGWIAMYDAAKQLESVVDLGATHIYMLSLRILMGGVFLPIFFGFIMESVTASLAALDATRAAKKKAAADEAAAKLKGVTPGGAPAASSPRPSGKSPKPKPSSVVVTGSSAPIGGLPRFTVADPSNPVRSFNMRNYRNGSLFAVYKTASAATVAAAATAAAAKAKEAEQAASKQEEAVGLREKIRGVERSIRERTAVLHVRQSELAASRN